jgi:putative membrane protein
MKQILGLLLVALILVSIQSCQSNKRANNYNNKALVDDSGLLFLKNGTEASLTAVKASGLAISNSKNQKIIQFAKTMIDDHTVLADDLKKLETDNFVTTSDTINPVHVQTIANLEQKKATDFDKAYMDMLISEHERELTIYKAATRDKSPNVSDFAQKTMPSLQAHLDSAKRIAAILK